MQCSMIPKVTYLDSFEIIMAQRKAVFDKIYKITLSNKIYPGVKDLPKDPNDIPGKSGQHTHFKVCWRRAIPKMLPSL